MSLDDPDTYIDLSTLRLADGACEELATRCELLRSAFASVIARLETFAPVNHAIFGDCEEGRGWGRVLHDAALASSGSLGAVLEQHRSVLTEFAESYRRIGDAYLDVDRSSADRSRKAMR
ncbi:hypothetical protein BST43_19175 [Mycobacteroides saopaulense]|uniref:Uncharacterized protein n=1 Tax=Mycobacteroides saopaulense TaxID=1578165 RepID=A0A1S4VLH5_9MYCO|nr:hypothetical protein [Mycobacteroides saopaulense]ALR11622.1 hypothetical protein MYCSP_09320 [Mycobacteroides saopaulense]ORB52597.1 hypothetical protein BST43_19175 [Mycobacteroides saopaulense]